ncbi:MAG: phosphoserine phosphatase SerB [Deltaproteobacteria bacterium]|nr:phosphoserine phosphatase SerB [Deltaproteobacteria bacterium]
MTEERSHVMVTISGRDRPGITAALTRVLVTHQVEILDIEQSSLQNLLGLYFLLDLSRSSRGPDSVIKDLLFEASKLGLNLHFNLFSPGELQPMNHKNLYVLTHFGGTQALAELARVLEQENANIETISTATHHGVRSMEMVVNAALASSPARLKNALMLKSRELQVDLAVQKMEAYRKNKRLIFFDVDSTLVDMEIIDEMARSAGVFREVARITEKAMRGDFDFEESLVQRVALLKGLGVDQLDRILLRVPLSDGIEELATTLKWLGYKLGIVTGGFDFFATHLQKRLGFDFVHANRLEIREGRLTGRVAGRVIDANQKAMIVSQVSCDLGIPMDQIVVVGDGANDALMLGQAGLAIAYNAKRRLESVASASLGKSRMGHIFHLLGITEEDIQEAMSCKQPSS